ncbi:UDP-N-acetylmuramate--alanine ligase [Thermosinus carboxydivorans Nor1]|uniref:UDP-N-acetylmuramate--L-alanine ligase n=1 Tax=Thermosinus carboxydivorans Nor1 TaxID=401526 RepID=A1HU50_9FIRM|nr:UDP-N-acetylmuramate--L-alanine ligase [Thermosinus carboxydivorans]EAX46434.1 UDP-N-acetylmuramate--alanine ligase [Thermosinus carboxydivorans Nor1]
MLEGLKKIHFVGIGGAGMSAIATVLLAMNYQISGSDINQSETTRKLEQMGAKVFIGHRSENIRDVEAIVVSSAIPESNPEIRAAREQGLKIFHRADIVAALMAEREGIAIAGAHGKTTTTSMIALVLEKAGLDPTVLIGGELEYIGGNAKYGKGRYLVAEADESDGSFLKLTPRLAVVTNIENDHMDFYETMENILFTFKEFLYKIHPKDGLAVLCFDNSYIRNIAASLDRPYISYAINHDAEFTARNIRVHGPAIIYDAYRHNELLGTIRLNVPGRHNVANSLAALAVGLHVGLTFSQVADGLASFLGAKRRFQTKGRVNGIWVVDDYAHHPTEITTTLLAAREMRPKRLICVFQPHRYSRTKFLRSEFGRAFEPADILVLTDIYPAGEKPIPGITGEVIKEEVERQTNRLVTYIPDRNNIARYLAEIAEPGDLIITMGAGNIYQAGEELVEKLNAVNI